jgi:hypothetical protein
MKSNSEDVCDNRRVYECHKELPVVSGEGNKLCCGKVLALPKSVNDSGPPTYVSAWRDGGVQKGRMSVPQSFSGQIK